MNVQSFVAIELLMSSIIRSTTFNCCIDGKVETESKETVAEESCECLR